MRKWLFSWPESVRWCFRQSLKLSFHVCRTRPTVCSKNIRKWISSDQLFSPPSSHFGRARAERALWECIYALKKTASEHSSAQTSKVISIFSHLHQFAHSQWLLCVWCCCYWTSWSNFLPISLTLPFSMLLTTCVDGKSRKFFFSSRKKKFIRLEI